MILPIRFPLNFPFPSRVLPGLHTLLKNLYPSLEAGAERPLARPSGIHSKSCLDIWREGRARGYAVGTPDAPTQEGFTTLRGPVSGGKEGVYTILYSVDSNLEVVEGSV
jgi:hypothetical protein